MIPTEAEAGFDIRIPPRVNLEEFRKHIEEWTAEEGMTYEFTFPATMDHHVTDIKEDSHWFRVFKEALEKQ